MDMNDYTFELVVRSRLAELRAEAELWHRIGAGRPRGLRNVARRSIMMATLLIGRMTTFLTDTPWRSDLLSEQSGRGRAARGHR